MSQENAEVVRELISVVNDRDLDPYLAHCTESIQLETPWAEVAGACEGPDAMRRFFSDLRDTLPDFQLVIERREPIGADRILALLRGSATGRASGITAGRMCSAGPAAIFPPRPSATSSAGRSDGSESSSTARKPSKPPASGVGHVRRRRRRSGVVLEEPADLLVRPLEGRAVLDAQGGADHECEQSEGHEVDKDEAHLHQMMLASCRTSVTSVTGHVGGGNADYQARRAVGPFATAMRQKQRRRANGRRCRNGRFWRVSGRSRSGSSQSVEDRPDRERVRESGWRLPSHGMRE
jgi:SnoaL-like domain